MLELVHASLIFSVLKTRPEGEDEREGARGDEQLGGRGMRSVVLAGKRELERGILALGDENLECSIILARLARSLGWRNHGLLSKIT